MAFFLQSKRFYFYYKINSYVKIKRTVSNLSKDLSFLCEYLNSTELDYAEENISKRKSDVNILEIKQLLNEIKNNNIDKDKYLILLEKLKNCLWKIPNKTHPNVFNCVNDKPILLKKYNEMPKFDFIPLSFEKIVKKLNLLRMEHLGNFNGHKSYYLINDLAELEHALIQYTVDKLKQYKFKLMSVPDILPSRIIEGCGMQTTGDRTQVYELENINKCLSGTSEMALAGYFSNETINISDLPVNLAAVSRCYRAETSGLQEEKGLYRVHQFTKVEMFSICDPNQSNDILEEFKNIEINLFKELGIHFQLLDMPPSELGNPAYRKYDIEAWMPGKNMWGEISSCSNCTDYQSKRLNIKIKNNENTYYSHTVNGTACAVPRMLIAIIENYQKPNGKIEIPKILRQFLNKEFIEKKKFLPELKLVKKC